LWYLLAKAEIRPLTGKREFFLKNAVKLFAVAAAVVLVFTMASCASLLGSPKQTVVTVTGIDSQYNDMYAIAGLSDVSGITAAAAMPQKISDGKITWQMLQMNGKDASVKGRHTVIIRISESSAMNAQTVFVYNGTALLQNIGRGNNTIPFEKFTVAAQ
jgi:hypothetical protein